MDESYFPIEVIIGEEKRIFETPEDLPEGVSFKISKTKVALPEKNIINTGTPAVWGGSEI